MVPELMAAFHVGASQLGRLSAVYFYAYALMQLPVGILLDRYGPKLIITSACFVCALGAFIFSHTDSLGVAEMARFLMGLGSACAFICALKLTALWFSPRRYTLLSSFLLTFGMLGAIGGQHPVAYMVHTFGWRHSMEYLAWIGFALCAFFIFRVENGPRFFEQKNTIENGCTWKGLRSVLHNPQIWLMAIFASLIYAPTPAFGELWGVPFIVSQLGVSSALAAKGISAIFVGWILGAPFFGFLADRFGLCMPYVKLGAWASLVSMLMIVFFIHHSFYLMVFFIFSFGFFSSSFILIFTLVKEAVGDESVATASGFLNMINEFAPALLQVGMGMLLDQAWSGGLQNGMRIYSAENYQHAAFSLLFVLVCALIVLYRIRLKKFH